MTKLNWEFENAEDCEIAWHNGYRIKAERDDNPENPLEAWDGNWPCLVYSGNTDWHDYDKAPGPGIARPIDHFTDAQLVHDQIAIAKVLGTSIHDLTENLDDGPVSYCWDGEFLREQFVEQLDYLPDGEKVDTFEELYKLLGYVTHNETSSGYCQGDWAEVLVVATPEAIKQHGCTAPIAEDDIAYTAKLWGYWAWGDVYGYVVEAPEVDDDGEVTGWEEVGSCWGYYGSDHTASGLEEGALDCIPDRPAPGGVLCAELEHA